jgi:glycosyltransferase involved in cell wall biosynthesis
MITKPFFSVIIATYNRAELIRRALRSLVSQTESDWEAIVIDDGSTDDTFERIRPFLKKHANIRYSKHLHKGMIPSKNAGIRESSGKYITFLDSDDEYQPSHLEVRKTLIRQNPEVQFLYGKVTVIGNPYVPDRFNPAQFVHIDHCVAGGNFFIKSSALRRLKGFRNLTHGSDADLFDRAKLTGLIMLEVQLPTYTYHHDTSDSITNRMIITVI